MQKRLYHDNQKQLSRNVHCKRDESEGTEKIHTWKYVTNLSALIFRFVPSDYVKGYMVKLVLLKYGN